MTTLDQLVDECTKKGSNILPRVILMAVTKSGNVIYSKTAGFKTLDSNAVPITSDSVFRQASATKIFTSIAALQCVERGLITLDESVHPYLPELSKQIISINQGDDQGRELFKYTAAVRGIALRQLLTHTSGVGYDIMDPVLKAWRKSRGEKPMAVSGQTIIKSFSTPLIFQPGESWMYGAGLGWVGLLVSRLNGGMSLEEYMQENIFKPLDMTSSTFFVKKHPEIYDRLVDCSTRAVDGKLIQWRVFNKDKPADEDGGGGLYSSVPDFIAALVDLLQDEPRLLKKCNVEQLFSPQLEQSSPQYKGFDAASKFYNTTLGALVKGLKVNHCLGGMLIEEDCDTSKTGTMAWAGSCGTIWFANRKEGVAGMYADGLFPPGHSKQRELFTAFLIEVWRITKDHSKL